MEREKMTKEFAEKIMQDARECLKHSCSEDERDCNVCPVYHPLEEIIEAKVFLEGKGTKIMHGYIEYEGADVYQSDASRTFGKGWKDEDYQLHALHGMVGEIGELHSLYQKVYQGHEFDEDHAKKELGDLLWFIAEYACSMGWALSDVMYTNIEKLKKRYPNGFDAEKSLHRENGDV